MSLAVLAGSVAALVLNSPAYAASYLDEAVQALQNGKVYISLQVRDINATTKEQLAEQAAATNVAVVVLPAEAADETGGNTAEFVAAVAQRTGHDTVVVAFGNDLEAGSRTLPSGKASELANKVEGENTTVGEAMLDFIAEVKVARPGDSSPEPGSGGIGVAGVVLIIALLLCLAATVATMVVRRRTALIVRREPKAPQSIEELLEEIQGLVPNVHNPQVRQAFADSQRHTRNLFARLEREGSDRIQEITARYRSLLTIVRDTAVKYVDIQANQEYLGDDARVLMDDGQRAIEQYVAGVHQNVGEVLRGSLTEFRVNTKMLGNSYQPPDPKV